MAEWLTRQRGPLTVFLIAALALGGIVWWERRPTTQDLVITTPNQPSSDAERWITVDVGGAVARPGIYTLRVGSRVADAIAAAGGESADADLTRTNRAAKLRDEQQVRVPRLSPDTPGTMSSSPNPTPVSSAARSLAPSPAAPLDINSAFQAQLEALPGIGPVTAQRIIAYREEHGSFSHIDQLKEAKLVNSSTFEKIKGLIVVQ